MNQYLSRPSRHGGPLAFITSTPDLASIPSRPLQRLLTAYHRILLVDELFPQRLGWHLGPLVKLGSHPDPGVRVLAIVCYSMQSTMTERERETAYWDSLGEPGKQDAVVEVGEEILADGQIVSLEADSWIIAFLESKRRASLVEELRIRFDDYYLDEGQADQIHDVELSAHIVEVSGVLLFKADAAPPLRSPLVITPSITKTLYAFSSFLSNRLPILLISPPGAGKTTLIAHLASQLYPTTPSQIISLHLSDTSIDPKSLLGSYVPSSTKSGTFEWIEGPVCAAMRAGKWLVFEDIDKASPEVLGTILPLVESLGPFKGYGDAAKISVPGKSTTVSAATGFALFATRSTTQGQAGTGHSSTFIGSHRWFEVHLPAPRPEEQQAILSSLFPRLPSVAVHRLVEIFDAVRLASSVSSTSTLSRANKIHEIGLRDLIKWTRRVEQYFPARHSLGESSMDVDEDDTIATVARIFSNSEVKDRMFLDASDVFFGATPRSVLTVESPSIGSVVAAQLDISLEQANWVLTTRTPDIHIERSHSDGSVKRLTIGRTSLDARPPTRYGPSSAGNATTKAFALHRPSLLLLEQLATSALYSEPLLLVGETGTGKTTAIQHIASLLSHPLTVFNLSNQTEVADLVGGFKPVDPRVTAGALQGRFSMLFNGTFNARKNVEFDNAARKAVQGGKWKRSVAMWRDASLKAIARIREVYVAFVLSSYYTLV